MAGTETNVWCGTRTRQQPAATQRLHAACVNPCSHVYAGACERMHTHAVLACSAQSHAFDRSAVCTVRARGSRLFWLLTCTGGAHAFARGLWLRLARAPFGSGEASAACV
eukprot:1573113-Pleurochrysis_carterae.AAC.1